MRAITFFAESSKSTSKGFSSQDRYDITMMNFCTKLSYKFVVGVIGFRILGNKLSLKGLNSSDRIQSSSSKLPGFMLPPAICASQIFVKFLSLYLRNIHLSFLHFFWILLYKIWISHLLLTDSVDHRRLHLYCYLASWKFYIKNEQFQYFAAIGPFKIRQ